MDSSRDNNCMGVQGWIGQTGGVDKRDTVRYIQSQRPGGKRACFGCGTSDLRYSCH